MLAQNNRISCFYCTAKCQCKGTMFTKLSTGYWKAPRTIKLQIQRPAGGCRLAKRHAVTSANFVLIFSSPQSCSIIHLHIFLKKILKSVEWKDKFLWPKYRHLSKYWPFSFICINRFTAKDDAEFFCWKWVTFLESRWLNWNNSAFWLKILGTI